MESAKKVQIEGNLEMKILGNQKGMTEASFTNGTQKMKERISDMEDTIG